MSINVAFFGYSWTTDLKPDAYQDSLMRALAEQGFRVKFFYSNYVTDKSALRGITPDFDRGKFLREMEEFSPAFVVSMNRGGLDQKLRTAIKAPVLTWIVDDFPHLFDPDGASSLDGIVSKKDSVIVSSIELHRLLCQQLPGFETQIHFIPSATHFGRYRDSRRHQDKPISFVGSYLDLNPTRLLVSEIANFGLNFSSLNTAVDKLRSNYRHDFQKTLSETGLEQVVLKLGWDLDKAKMEIANLISSQERLEAVLKTYDLGLHLYGSQSWVLPLLTCNPKSLQAYQANSPIRTQEDLASVYQTSKICFNVSQIQTGPALSYRVFDILASDALLIQPYHPDSDAYALFGSDLPFPTYRSYDELRSICQYFLANEEERADRVARCQQLVEKGYSFQDRVRDLIRIAGISPENKERTSTIIYTKTDEYTDSGFFLKKSQIRWIKSNIRRLLQKYFSQWLRN